MFIIQILRQHVFIYLQTAAICAASTLQNNAYVTVPVPLKSPDLPPSRPSAGVR